MIFSRVLRDSTSRFVGPSVGWSVGRLVGRSSFYIFMCLRSLASLLLPKSYSNSITAPAHPHATGVAVYPALLYEQIHARPRAGIEVDKTYVQQLGGKHLSIES